MSKKPIDEFEVDWDTWYVYKESDSQYEYCHFPSSVMGEDQRYKVTITLKTDLLGNCIYLWDPEEYCEIYGSGDWSKWTDYKDELREKLMADAMKRMPAPDAKKQADNEEVIEEEE